MAKKTWNQKLNNGASMVIEPLEKPMFSIPAGSKLLIPTPLMVQEYVLSIPKGQSRTIANMREDFAKKHGADVTCPLTSGIFVRIVAEAAWESGNPDAVPFWRLIGPKDNAAKKLSFGTEFLVAKRSEEGI